MKITNASISMKTFRSTNHLFALSSTSANAARRFVSKLSNGTYGPKHDNYTKNHHYDWIGGHVRDLSHNNSLLIGLFSKCSSMMIFHSRTSNSEYEHISWEIFRNGLVGFSIVFIPVQHSSSLCRGDSKFFREHPSRSQRLVRTGKISLFKDIKLFGHIDEKDMNPGPSGEDQLLAL